MLNAFKTWAVAVALGCAHLAAQAQTITLKVHHFLPAGSSADKSYIRPWCDAIAKDSGNRLKCQIYPSMQLGGTPPQLYDQVKDGVVDVVWTLPGYNAGRFPRVEAFELPFMMNNAEATSRALWQYVQQHAAEEFKDVHPILFHVHGPGVFHLTKKPIRTLEDFKGLKLRAPTRQTNKLLAALGATPVAMPVPQVTEAMAKGVIDGAVVPYEVVPALKLQELAKFHTETPGTEPALYTTVFIFAMNKARYEGLPPDLKQVIDKHSGLAMSAMAGRAFQQADAPGRQLTEKAQHNVIAPEELARWKQASQSVIDGWVSEMNTKGLDGKALLAAARQLIAQNANAR
ncbi:MAG: C4-dicarboxylate TRAP transporter substrate-binding protein [Rhodoferax sp.]